MKTKNFIKSIFFTILGVLLFQTSFCQENFLPGYVISSKGDTLRGFIDYRNWEKNPIKISFKERINDNKTIYTPMTIKGFGVSNEVYESAIIKTETSPDKTNELISLRDLKISIDTTFLQSMIVGPKSIYHYNNKIGKEQFYIKQDSAYELLVYKKYLKDQDGKTIVAENRNYIGQLTIYLQGCSSIQSKLKEIQYSKRSMENLFHFYYDCTQIGIKFQKKTPKVVTEIGVLTGMSVTTLKFSSNVTGFTYLLKANYKPSLNFTAGLFFDLILPRNQGKWSINNELVIASYKVNSRYNDYTNENKYTITSTSLDYTYIKINNLLRYKFPIGNIKFYLNAGISNGFAISETNYQEQESKLFTQVRVEEGNAIDFTRKHEVGFVLGLGSKIKRYSFEIRYEMGDGMSNVGRLSSSTKRYFLLLGYRF